VDGFSPFSLGRHMWWRSLKWYHKAIFCFHGHILPKETHSLLSNFVPLLSRNSLFCYKVLDSITKNKMKPIRPNMGVAVNMETSWQINVTMTKIMYLQLEYVDKYILF
jgi:hypothetical protein